MRPKQLLPVTIVLSVLFLVPNFIDYNINEDKQKITIREKFDPALTRLNSLSKLESYTDSLALIKNTPTGTLAYAILANEVVSKRFYHKYATQNLNENWIASLAQKFTGLFLSSKITADDILTKPYGYCGQQSTVLMELLQRKKINCRVLYLPHHFVIQGYIDQRWNYLDADLEPDILPQKRSDERFLQNKDSLAHIYKKDISWVNLNFGNPVQFKFGKINEMQGPHAQVFQFTTKILSRIAFIFPLVWYVSLKRKKRSATKNIQQTTQCWDYNFYSNERSGNRA